MKIGNINEIVSNAISNEVKKAILKSTLLESKDYYHVVKDGQPIETFETEEEAEQYVMDKKDEHTGKELIIDKKTYGSYEEMIDDLDKQGEQLEIKNTNMKKKLKENMDTSEYFSHEMDEQDDYLDMAYEDRTYLPDEPNDNRDFYDDGEYFDDSDLQSTSQYGEFDEEMSDCQECGQMKEDDMMQDMSEYELSDEMNEYDMMQDMSEYELSDEMTEDNMYMDEIYEEEQMCSECGSMLNEDGICNDCASLKSMEEEYVDEYDMMEEKHACSECGSMLNEEGVCNECGMPRSMEEYMFESQKRKVILKESELIQVIKKIVKESIPGLKAAEKSKKDSKKDNDDYYGEVAKKMKNYLQFEGNDNPEFPHQIGKGEKVARQNTTEEDDEVAKNFAGLQNLEYDVEPSQKFKERLKMSIEGHSKMGNGVYTEKPKIKPSNGAEKGKEAEEKSGNQIKTKTAEKINKQVKNRKADKEKRVIYKKEKVPVDTNKKEVNENKIPKQVLEEIQKMKKLTNYNDRTQ